jgi:hypothetical protein
MNKPNNQTVVTFRAVHEVMAELPMTKIRNFGGKVGEALMQLGCSTAADVQALSMATLVSTFGDEGRAECAPDDVGSLSACSPSQRVSTLNICCLQPSLGDGGADMTGPAKEGRCACQVDKRADMKGGVLARVSRLT